MQFKQIITETTNKISKKTPFTTSAFLTDFVVSPSNRLGIVLTWQATLLRSPTIGFISKEQEALYYKSTQVESYQKPPLDNNILEGYNTLK